MTVPHVRGLLLRGWMQFARGRFGDGLVARIRAEEPDISIDPEPLAWYPASWQLSIASHMVDSGCGGDELAAIDALISYGMSTAEPLALRAARWLGPRRVFRLAPRIHPHLYDVGTCQSQPKHTLAELRWSGADLFGDPTWRLLQRAAVLGAVRACGRNGRAVCGAGSARSFSLTVNWGK